MSNQEEFDLAGFLGDSLSIQNNIAAPVRFESSKTAKIDEYYDQFSRKDPYKVLGEIDFKRREEIKDDTIGTPIQEFYRGANVLITGATGFIGKILTEKLIRSIPHIGQVYILIRTKRGLSPTERFEKLMQNKVFNRMKAEVPDYATRLTPVEGDLAAPGMGLSPDDRRKLADHVNVVFHSAADVRFIEPLHVAVASNVHGSQRVMDLAREMKNLRAYVHVSTAYSQCVRNLIEENVPNMNFNYREILDYIASKTEEEIIEETPRLLQGWPNTYTFSKAICEEIISKDTRDLPICIFRPSMVVPTYREPVRGWTDNVNGPMGVYAGVGHGILHCYKVDPGSKPDMVPVDLVVNCMIAVAWRTFDEKNCMTNFPTVYNFTQRPAVSGLTWNSRKFFFLDAIDMFPFTRSLWYHHSFFFVQSDYFHQVCWYLLHRAPGELLDKLSQLTGGKPYLSKIYGKIEKVMPHLSYFTFRQWEFKSDNVANLWRSLGEDDQKMFPFDLRDVDPREFALVSTIGYQIYFLNERLDNYPAARRRLKWLYWLHQSVKLACCFVALKILVVTSNAFPF